ncbi:hypothetical protein [Paraconexibacter sp. AEG42_29]|uniref:hypothetical protein n=1 Tax=Paraconexibacter sp. AEG42_29 TaxID=2997339 RepID=UPI00339D4743
MDSVAAILDRFTPELLDWFCVTEEDDDAPELHVVGLRGNDLSILFQRIAADVTAWSGRTFWLEPEELDVTVAQRPDVADLILAGRSSSVCVGALSMNIEGIEISVLEMFLYADEIQFFWWPQDGRWGPVQAAAIVRLVGELLELAPAAEVRPDPRYPEQQRLLAPALAQALGSGPPLDSSRVR